MQATQKRRPFSSKSMAGLGLALLAPTLYTLWIGPVFLQPRVGPLSYALIGFSVYWALALGVLVFTRLVEKRLMVTIGWKPLAWKWAAAAVGIGILLSLLVPILTLLVSAVLPAPETGSIAEVTASLPWWVILLSVITAGVTEEILFRGYALERLLEGTGSAWLSAGVSVAFFVAGHAAGWNAAHVLGVVLPLGVLMTGLYLWRRNLPFVMIVHVMIDLPLVFMALGAS